MKLLNLCPHDVAIRDHGVLVILPALDPAGARCGVETEVENEEYMRLTGFRVIEAPVYGEVIGLPTEHDDGSYGIVVSLVVGQRIARSPEMWSGPVFGPDSGPTAIREHGNITEVTGLILYKN